MEITNEIKAKVFAQYLGQRIRPNPKYQIPEYYKQYFDDPNNPGTYECKGSLITTGAGRDLLILRPLSEITDEDAIEVCRMVISEIKYPVQDYHIKRHNTSIEVQLNNSHFMDSVFIGYSGNAWTTSKHPRYGNNVFGFLTSRGYDQKQYLLNNQTLQEAGLAIYESNKRLVRPFA
jgi:hypothetical protein